MTTEGISLHRPRGSRSGCDVLRRLAGTWWMVAVALTSALQAEPAALVLQTDFGTKDGAVAAMKGVAVGVDRRLPIFDLTHEITPYAIAEAAYRLKQTAAYWPAGTVFVSVVDPGVGTERASVVLRTKSGHLFVSPDNGTLTWVAEDLGIDAVRQIDETINRLAGSEQSYTFHGRDVYAYTGARLAAGAITFEAVGPLRSAEVVRLPHRRAERQGEAVVGSVPVLDINYGNVWTNISAAHLAELGLEAGAQVRVTISHGSQMLFTGVMPFVTTFGEVPPGEPLLYLNSLLHASIALNQASFAERYEIQANSDTVVRIERAPR